MKGNLPKWQSVWTFSLEGLGILKMYSEFLVPGQFFILLIKSFTGVQGAVLQKSPLAGHMSGVNSAVYSPDGKKILSASADGTIKEWDAGTGQSLKTHDEKDHPDLDLSEYPNAAAKLEIHNNKIIIPAAPGKRKKRELLNIPGLFIQGCSFRELEKGSQWTREGLEILKMYGART